VSDEQMRDWLERARAFHDQARAFQTEMDEAGFGRQGHWPVVAHVGGGDVLHAARMNLQPGDRRLVTRCGCRFGVTASPSAKGYGPSCRRCLQLLARDQQPAR